MGKKNYRKDLELEITKAKTTIETYEKAIFIENIVLDAFEEELAKLPEEKKKISAMAG